MRYLFVTVLFFLISLILVVFIQLASSEANYIEARNPEVLGMIDVKGAEISNIRHLGSHFNDYQGEVEDLETNGASEKEKVDYTLEEIAKRDGLAQFFHPGRYTENDPNNYGWYLDFYEKHDHLVGLEVYNRADKYPKDRKLWDNLLSYLMPERPIWAFGNDDNHHSDPDDDFLVSWNVFLLDELTLARVKSAYKSGKFLAKNRTGKDSPTPPIVKEIGLDDEGSKIYIEARNYDEIKWIAEGEVIGSNSKIDVSTLEDKNYVRAKLIIRGQKDKARTLTQPFGIKDEEVINPYREINWNNVDKHKANLHTHTTYSDGTKPPHERIDEYRENGYTILSITDHATYDPGVFLTSPWKEFSEYDFIELSIENSIMYYVHSYLPEIFEPILEKAFSYVGEMLSFKVVLAFIYFIVALFSYLAMEAIKPILLKNSLVWQGVKIFLSMAFVFSILGVLLSSSSLLDLILAGSNSLKFLAMYFGALTGVVFIEKNKKTKLNAIFDKKINYRTD